MAGEFRLQGRWNSEEQRFARAAIAPKQLRFALSLGLNTTARRVKSNEQRAMPQRLDRPTPFTMKSLYMASATKDRPEARVWFKDFAPKGTPAGAYLQPQVAGGGRKPKRFERAMQHRGFIKPGQYAVPASGIKLNKYGNVPGSTMTKIWSGIGAFSEVGFNANATVSRRSLKKGNAAKYFFGNVRGQEGVWQRLGAEHIKPMFTIHDGSPKYRSRFPFFKIAENTVAAHYDKDMIWALDRALSPNTVRSFSPVAFRS